MSHDPFYFHIDVVGSCNLKCPSCPVGNSRMVENPKGFMEPELLDAILRKATGECQVEGVGLFNWTEPLLHPKLPELVKIVRSYGISCDLSSNLNILKNTDELLLAEPTSFRISTSGFTQETYGSTHLGGNIERVKKNILALAESKQRTGSKTNIYIYYHRYLTNLEEESLMEKLARDVGFGFHSAWAYMMPLEKSLAYMGNSSIEAKLTQEDQELINKLALPLAKGVKAAQKYSDQPCRLRDRQMALDFEGNVQLCCAVYDASKYTLASYLSTSLAELQSLKYSSKVCESCMSEGLHVFLTYGTPELDKVAKENIFQHDPKLGLKLYWSEMRTGLWASVKRQISPIKRKVLSLLRAS